MAKTTHKHAYENNPFFIGLNGLKLFFNNAQSVAIYALVLCAVLFVLSMVANVVDAVNSANGDAGQRTGRQIMIDEQGGSLYGLDVGQIAVAAVLIASFLFIVILIILVLNGVLEYTGARLALGETVGLTQAFREVFRELAGYLWVNIVMIVKLFLWTLLLIVPGIIMAVRYRLAGTVFFAEGKRGNAAVKRSAELTKGAWFTTQAGYGLWNLITFNQIPQLLTPGSSAILYRQLRDVTDAGGAKPPAHWLSWLTFLVPLAIAVLFIMFVLVLVLLVSSSFGP